MANSLIISFIGNDRPGLIESVSQVVSEHHGNWLESRMSHMAGKFAGIARVHVSAENASDLTNALNNLNSSSFTIAIEISDNAQAQASTNQFTLGVVGQDRPGIVREVSQALASRHINILEMNTDVTSAPMTAEPLFEASATIEAPTELAVDELETALDQIANELNIDIVLEENK